MDPIEFGNEGKVVNKLLSQFNCPKFFGKVGKLVNWQVGYKVYGKSIVASGLQNTASTFTAT